MTIESKRVVAILLAAGRSERFGSDKLGAPFEGRPLAHHAARQLSAIGFTRRIVVMGSSSVDIAQFGFGVVRPPAGSPMSASIARGVREAEATDCDACLIALADMPLIPEGHFRGLMRAHVTDVTATRSGERNMVPALFGRTMFPLLRQLAGDEGASRLLSEATSIEINEDWLADVDLPDDLSKMQVT